MRNNIIYILFLFICTSAIAQTKQQQVYLPTHSAIRYMGRIDVSNPLRPTFWQPGVSIEWAFSGDSCGIIIEDEIKWGSNHNYIELVVDGEPKRFKLSKRLDTIWVKPTNKKVWHQLLLCKNTEANIGALTFVGIVANTIQAPATKYALKIESIGNSITCGTGSDGVFLILLPILNSDSLG